MESRTIVFYHGSCPDGFGGAYAAWKTFGDAATYVPLKHNVPMPDIDVSGARVYFIDFCYTKPVMDRLVAASAHLTVLDHHAGVRDVVETMPEYVFDNDRSGATIAWSYFHPGVPTPRFLTYVQEGDLYRMDRPETRPILTYAYAKPFTFEVWDALAAEIEDDAARHEAIKTGTVLSAYFVSLADKIMSEATLVEFEGRTCYLASAPEMFSSDVGNRLARKHPPYALVARVREDGLRISLRGDDSIDVSEIARKYGGNGHYSASGFSIPFGDPVPWKPVPAA